MIRIPFYPDFARDILEGNKRATSRWGPPSPRWRVGETCAAIAVSGGGRGFEYADKEVFATLRCTYYAVMFWKDFTEELAAECGVTREWYERKGKRADEETIHFYRFEVVQS